MPVRARLLYAGPNGTRYLPSPDTTLIEPTKRLYRHVSERWSPDGFGEWTVADRETGAFRGRRGLNHITDVSKAERDDVLARHAWGRGLAIEAIGAAIRFTFETAGLTRPISFVVPEHVASCRVLKRVGFVYERDTHDWGVALVCYGLDPEQFHGSKHQSSVAAPAPTLN